MLRTPPDILITTPESLFLLLTSQARETLRGIETVIVDEVHAVAGTKRGAHLALSPRAARAPRRAAVPAGRSLGDSAPARGDRSLRRGHGTRDRARRRGNAQGARPRGRRPGRGHARARLDGQQASGSPRPRSGRLRGSSRNRNPHSRTPILRTTQSSSRAARSGPRSTPRSSSSSARIARRSCSSTTGGWPSDWRFASTSSRKRRSHARITARWRESSASSWRSC